MTLHQDRPGTGRHQTPPEYTPRLRLKPKAEQSGYVDGAWWPWTDDLTTELPDLLAVLSVRLGAIDRVLYKFDEWVTAPRKLVAGGRTVRLDGYKRQPTSTLEVLGVNRDKIVLLIIPTHTQPDQAHDSMMAAAGPGNDTSIDDLLMVSASDKRTRARASASEARWAAGAGAPR